MYKTDGLKHYSRIYGQDLADAQAVPQNATWSGSPVKLDGINGAVEVVARVNAAANIADTKTITVTLEHAAADLVYSTLATLYTLTAAAGSGALAKDTELGRFALPSTVKENLRVKVVTDDAAASGKLDVIPTYLAR